MYNLIIILLYLWILTVLVKSIDYLSANVKFLYITFDGINIAWLIKLTREFITLKIFLQ